MKLTDEIPSSQLWVGRPQVGLLVSHRRLSSACDGAGARAIRNELADSGRQTCLHVWTRLYHRRTAHDLEQPLRQDANPRPPARGTWLGGPGKAIECRLWSW